MPTRLTPLEARGIAEAKAKAELEARSKGEAEAKVERDSRRRQRRQESLARAKEERAWQLQKRELLLAAVEGYPGVWLHRQLIRAHELLESGFDVCGESVDPEELTELKRKEVDAASAKSAADDLLSDAVLSWAKLLVKLEPELRPHEKEVYEEIQSEMREILDPDLIRQMDEESRMDLSESPEDYSRIRLEWHFPSESTTYLSAIDMAELSKYKETHVLEGAMDSWRVACLNWMKIDESLEDLKDLPPTAPFDSDSILDSKPPYLLQWEASDLNEPWNQRLLLSAAGLSWFSGVSGQVSIAHLEGLIARAAENQESSLAIEIEYSALSGHFLQEVDGRRVYYPPSNELIEVLACLGWSATAENRSDTTYLLQISW